jgi:hypothetical protein
MKLRHRLGFAIALFRLQTLRWRCRARVAAADMRSARRSPRATKFLQARLTAWLPGATSSRWRMRAAVAMGGIGLAAVAHATASSWTPLIGAGRANKADQVAMQPYRQSAPTVPMQGTKAGAPVPLVRSQQAPDDSRDWANSAALPRAAGGPQPARVPAAPVEGRERQTERDRNGAQDGRRPPEATGAKRGSSHWQGRREGADWAQID